MRSHFALAGEGGSTCRLSGTAPILRHRLPGRKRKSLGHCQTVANDPCETCALQNFRSANWAPLPILLVAIWCF